MELMYADIYTEASDGKGELAFLQQCTLQNMYVHVYPGVQHCLWVSLCAPEHLCQSLTRCVWVCVHISLEMDNVCPWVCKCSGVYILIHTLSVQVHTSLCISTERSGCAGAIDNCIELKRGLHRAAVKWLHIFRYSVLLWGDHTVQCVCMYM